MKKRKLRKKEGKHGFWRVLWHICRVSCLMMFVGSWLWVLILRWQPVWVTPLMARRAVEAVFEGREVKIRKQWVALEEMNRMMPLAVVASEDNLFCKHYGFSENQIRKAIADSRKGKRLRGGSTISQQTAKNVFTFGTRTWMRKAVEAYYTLLIEIVWGKKRIMEVYLNVVELGDGVYGVEAASQLYFHHSANMISKGEAALLAAALPSPRRYSVTNPGPYMQKRKGQVMDLMGKVRWSPEKRD